ncbi:MAG: hypothetical protein QOG39_2026 [Acidimicrobiaceae bacterium]
MLSNHRRMVLSACALAMAVATLGACSDSKPTRVLGETIERSGSSASASSSSPAPTSAPTTTTTAPAVTAPTTTATPTTTTAAAPPTEAPLPPPIIEVDYQAPDGSTAVASIDGPSGHFDQALDSGVAVFDGLDEGVYDIVVSVNTPTPPTDTTGATVGPSNASSRGRVEVHPGDHAVISCTGYADCSGLL